MVIDRQFDENFSREAEGVLKVFVPKITQIWKQMGFPATKVQERFQAAISHHKELWESMLEEEQNNKKKLLSTIDRLGRQYHQLCKELGTQYREFDENLPLLEMEKQLQDKIASLNKEKEERMKFVKVMFHDEEQLCRRLAVNPFPLNHDKIPTAEQLKALQDNITKLRTEVVTRQAQYESLRSSIRDKLQQLEMSARSSFEVSLFVSDPQTVSLSDDEMNKIKELNHGLTNRLEINKRKASDLLDIIKTLWERLDVESEVREIFLMENKGFAPSTIVVLERELSRLEELKRQNIERFIKAVREDLVQWWERCFVSESDRLNFSPFYADVYTEDILELHEAQVEKYRSLYNNNKEIFTKVQHRENLWKRMEDIEAKSRDPSRLFGNRGCSLLQEEKERKKIMKELPRVEDQLNELFNSYEKTHNHMLLIYGQDYRKLVNEQWSIYTEQKENEKLQRQRDRAEKLVEEAKVGAKPTTPMKRRLGTTSTGLRTHLESPKAKQRKLLAPSTAPQQRPTRKILTEALVSQLPQSQCSKDQQDVSLISTYSAFTASLRNKAKRDQCVNSTVLLENNKGTPASHRGSVLPSTLPRRRSPRLAPLTPSTPVSHHSMLRRSRTQASMAPPLSAARLTPSRSTPKLTVTKHPRPFLV